MMDPRLGEISAEELDRSSRDSDNFMMIGMLSPPRPNFQKFMVALEHKHYSPDFQALNDKFGLALVNFEGMIFGVITIPAGDRPKAEEIAKECGLRFADGTPVVIGPLGPMQFPVRGPSAWSVESVAGSEVYKGPAVVDEMLSSEHDDIKEMFDRQHNKN
jgi:hypothetical protein